MHGAKIALIIYGPPGSGKSTQADLAAKQLGLIHFDTGKYLEEEVNDPKNAKNKTIQKEKVAFDTGKLLTPSWVFRVVRKKVKEIGKSNFGIVFSGSPRTLYEAKGLMPVLEKIYGKKNIYAVLLEVGPNISIERNSNRLVCAYCRSTTQAILAVVRLNAKEPLCLACGAGFRRRTLDKPEIIKVRLKEYAERTEPIFAFLKKRGYALHKIDGTPAPYKVFDQILKVVKG